MFATVPCICHSNGWKGRLPLHDSETCVSQSLSDSLAANLLQSSHALLSSQARLVFLPLLISQTLAGSLTLSTPDGCAVLSALNPFTYVLMFIPDQQKHLRNAIMSYMLTHLIPLMHLCSSYVCENGMCQKAS